MDEDPRHGGHEAFGQYGTAGGVDTLHEMGILPTKNFQAGQFPGHERIAWGDSRRAYELIGDIAHRRGLGDLLAEGVARASRRAGGEDFAMHVKGLEVPMHEPRGKKGLGLSYAVSPRGASHMQGFHDTMIAKKGSPELGVAGKMDRFSVEGKADVARRFEDARSFVNCQILCVFDVGTTEPGYNLHLVREMVNAASGLELGVEGMLAVGERAVNLARLFSNRMGAGARDDDLPRRFKETALPYGERREALSEAELYRMTTEYYATRGWDEAGRPTRERLDALGIDVRPWGGDPTGP